MHLPMPHLSLIQRRLVQALLALFALLTLALCASTAWLATHEDFLQQKVIEGLEAGLGQPAHVESVRLALTPRPLVIIENVASSGPVGDFLLPKVVFAPSLTSLLLAQITPAHLQLTAPHITLKQLPSSQDSRSSSPTLPKGCRLVIENGNFALQDARFALSAAGIDCYLKIRANNELQGDLFMRKAEFAMANISWSLEDFLFLGHISPFDIADSNSRFDLKAMLRGPSWLHSMGVQLTIGKEKGLWQCATDIRGVFLQNDFPLPFSLKGMAGLSRDYRQLSLEQAAISLGNRDSGLLNATFDSAKERLDGKLHLNHVSLTEWLGFARNLPPGLMRSLDHVTNADLDFHLDRQGLEVPKIVASCSGADFTGHGGVKDWSKPVVFLDMHAPHVDLIRAIPEAGAILPKSPVYGHGPLTPEGDPTDISPSSVGYDIRLGAARVDYGPLRIDGAKVNIHPEGTRACFQAISPSPSTYPAGKKNVSRDILVDASARFYDGQFLGSLALGGEEDTRYAIKALFIDVNGQKVGQAMPVIPVRRGKWQAQASVTSQGIELDTFLQDLRGQVKVDCRHGELHTPGSAKNLAFSAVHLKLEPLRQGQWKNEKLFLDGLWKVSLERSSMAATLQLAGKIGFGVTRDGSGVDFQNLETTFSVNRDADTEPEFWGDGRLFWLSDKSLLRAQNAQLQSKGGRFSGTAELGFAKEAQITAKGDFAVSDLALFIASVSQVKVHVPDFLRKLKGQSKIEVKTDSLKLSDMVCQTDLGTVRGAFGLDWSRKLTLLPELVLDSLNTERFLGGQGKRSGQRGKIKYQGIENVRARGSLGIQELTHKGFHFANIRLPIDLSDGVCSMQGITGKLYGGKLEGQATLVFSHKSIELQSNGALKDVSLAAFASETMKNAQMTGSASLSGKMRAAFTSLAEWPGCLWGEWGFRAKNGSYQAFKANGQPNSKPTVFSQLSAQGNIAQGVLTSKNVQLLGDGLKLTGKGELNLNKLTIDCTFEVDKKGMPYFPIYIEGTLDKTKTSIGAGQLILNAIGGMFGGLIGIFR